MRALFFGLGGIGQRHLRNLRELLGDDLEVHAYRVRRENLRLTDTLEVGGHDLEDRYAVTVHASAEAALAQKPDAAFICNPTSMHVDTALACARAGVPMFLEKPVSDDLAGIGALQAAVEANQVPVYVGFQLRFHPGVRAVRALLERGALGRVMSAQAEIGEFLPNWHRYEDYRQGYAARAALGGGVIATQTHEIDLLYWFFGLPRSLSTAGGKLSDLELDVEDTASTLMRYDGVSGNFPVLLHQDYLQRPPTRTLKLVGTDGIVALDLVDNHLIHHAQDGSVLSEDHFDGFVRNDMFRDQMRHVLGCLSGAEPPLVGLYDGTQSLRLTAAMRLSLAERREVQLSEITA